MGAGLNWTLQDGISSRRKSNTPTPAPSTAKAEPAGMSIVGVCHDSAGSAEQIR